jgi:hypothetical protein
MTQRGGQFVDTFGHSGKCGGDFRTGRTSIFVKDACNDRLVVVEHPVSQQRQIINKNDAFRTCRP